MKIITAELNKDRDVTLTGYIEDVGGEYRYVTERPAVLVIPGGGYAFCSDREAEPVALQYLKAGFDAFVLRYSVGAASRWPAPLEDYENAMEYIETRADAWHIRKDRIAVAGFSAGGHLAGMAATRGVHRPAAAILGYAVLRENTTQEINASAPCPVDCVDYNTCPCFLFASRTDNVVPIQNTIDMENALNRYGISFETHIYAYGPHGFSTADSSVQPSDTRACSRISDWVEDSIAWLRDMLGDFGPDGLTRPAIGGHVTDDAGAWLSLDCTVSRIFGNPKAKEVLSPTIEKMKEKITPFAPGMTFDDMMNLLGKMTLRDLLIERRIDTDRLDELNGALQKLPNI